VTLQDDVSLSKKRIASAVERQLARLRNKYVGMVCTFNYDDYPGKFVIQDIYYSGGHLFAKVESVSGLSISHDVHIGWVQEVET
jgi:hypothetical protein